MLRDDLAVYTRTKEMVRIILVRRNQLKRWAKMLEDEDNIDIPVVVFWQEQYKSLQVVS